MEISLIPETAPFNAEQRAWLNGFLAGWLGLQGSPAGAPPVPTIAPKATIAPAPAETEPEPWHDPALPIDERLRLAEDKPLKRRLMAAMAQLDCGACGYLCHTYSEAIAEGTEASLTLCAPGGAETAKTLKRLVKEQKAGSNGTTSNGPAATAVKSIATNHEPTGWSRNNPFLGTVIRSQCLNLPGSEKETRHVEIDLAGGPTYEVGDSLGVYPENCGALVDELIGALGAQGDSAVRAADGSETTLRDALACGCCLSQVNDELLAQLAEAAADSSEAEQIRALMEDDAAIAGFDVVDVLNRFPSARPSPGALVAALDVLKPRLYSISSSPKKHAGQVHLTVRRVSYEFNGRVRKGVASTMFADRVTPGTPVRVFVQKAHGFTLPDDPQTPIIMIGPGTGIAPFRAFLHERDALNIAGRSWLFFGDQRMAFDFLYEAELLDFLRRGVLSRLDTAFSRDFGRKLYVQNRIVECGADVFGWLEDGACVYVCGDAKRMAQDVDRALRAVVSEHGGKSEEDAAEYIEALTSSGRYRRDVY